MRSLVALLFFSALSAAAAATESRQFELVCDSAYVLPGEASSILTSEGCVEICHTHCSFVDTPGKISACLHANGGSGCAFKSIKPILHKADAICAEANLVATQFKGVPTYLSPFSVSLYITGVTMSSECALKGKVSLAVQTGGLNCSASEGGGEGWETAAYDYIDHISTVKIDATDFLTKNPSADKDKEVSLKIELPTCANSIGDEATLAVATKQWGILNLRTAHTRRSNWLSYLWPF